MTRRPATIEVRTFRTGDLPELRRVFTRAGEGEPPLLGEADEDVWLLPYVECQPESLYLARVDGRIAGYLTGCVGWESMPSEEERVVAAVRRHRLWLRPRVLTLLVRSASDSVRDRRRGVARELRDPRWPAHLHVRLVPPARGLGAGSALVRRWQRDLTERAIPGCHLQVQAEHRGAVAFFERMGFERHGDPARIPGLRGPRGQRLHQQTMVWSAVSRVRVRT